MIVPNGDKNCPFLTAVNPESPQKWKQIRFSVAISTYYEELGVTQIEIGTKQKTQRQSGTVCRDLRTSIGKGMALCRTPLMGRSLQPLMDRGLVGEVQQIFTQTFQVFQ